MGERIPRLQLVQKAVFSAELRPRILAAFDYVARGRYLALTLRSRVSVLAEAGINLRAIEAPDNRSTS